MRNGVDKHWVRSIDGKLTFCGALETYYDECAVHWKSEKTRTQYDRDYNDKILPSLPVHNDRTIETYTKEDYDAAVQAIIEKGQGREDEPFKPYADTTIQHFRHLIKRVVEVAAENGMCSNVLWGSVFQFSEDVRVKDAINERVRLKKSLTVKQEHKIAKLLLADVQQQGQNLGLLLMFALGLRNGEACGANFGDIKRMENPTYSVLWVYKSTIAGTNTLQSSGKTRNADRIIPIPSVLVQYLAERRRYLEQVLTETQEIESLPIACVGSDFERRCSAAQLTAAGRELFRRAEMAESQLAYIDAELMRNQRLESAYEKDPTAYLLRRNFGTHLHILGLSEAEIEYVIGHDIQDSYETRNEFVNEEKLYEIKQKLDQRPILNDESGKTMTTIQLKPNEVHTFTALHTKKLRFAMRHGQLKLHFYANEPQDVVEVRYTLLPKDAIVHKKTYVSTEKPQYERTVLVQKKYRDLYKRKK